MNKKYYLAFIMSPELSNDMKALSAYGAYQVLEPGLVLICDAEPDAINKNHGIISERDAICRTINPDAHVIVVALADLSAAWFLSEDSSNTLKSLFDYERR